MDAQREVPLRVSGVGLVDTTQKSVSFFFINFFFNPTNPTRTGYYLGYKPCIH